MAAGGPAEAGEAIMASIPRVKHQAIVEAIAAAERRTAAEVRVVVGRHRTDDPYQDAKRYFEKLGLGKSAHRNTVLIFVSPRSRRFAIIGDSAVHEKCGDAFWTELVESMAGFFRRDEITDGIVHGVERAGDLLARHFPRH